MEKSHHSDSDFNNIWYIGLFQPIMKLVKAKNLYTQNFSKYDPPKSEGEISRFVITWLWIIENMHMHSDFSLEKAALSRGNGNFPFQVNKKNLNIKKPRSPPWTLFFRYFIFSLKTLTYFSNYQAIKIMEPEFHKL